MGVSETDWCNLFAYASHTFFRVGSLVFMVAAIQDDVLGSRDLSRERDELRERCEALDHKFFDAEKELAKLRADADVVNSLQENVDQYGRPFILVA